MLHILYLWFIFAFFSFGIIGINYIYAQQLVKKPWNIKKNKNDLPSVSIIIPTYNEDDVIGYKIKNLSLVKYPRNLLQIIFIDSKSTDSTVKIIKTTTKDYLHNDIELIVENERKGKSFALNRALKICKGDVVIISDADCFWRPNILVDSLPYLADPAIGAVSGPKILLNPNDSYVTRSEDEYLKAMNLLKLGNSKICSTIFFEGGFSAYKKQVLDSFDPYETGSDDCGTVINILEQNYRCIMVPEAAFFTIFPDTWKEKIEIKIRRASQILQIYKIYLTLLLSNRLEMAKNIIINKLVLFYICPFMFLCFLMTSGYLISLFPFLSIFLLFLLIPRIRNYFLEAVFNYFILLYSIILSIFHKKYIIWKKPQSRTMLNKSMLLSKNLI